MPQPIVINRVFSAPVEKVWAAWSAPEEAMKWWGPNGFTCPHAEIDFCEGGKYLLSMRGGETMPVEFQKDMWSTGMYKEIIPMEKIVSTDSFADKDGNIVPASAYGMPGEFPLELEVELTFKAQGDATAMTLVHNGMPEEAHKDCIQGWNESFDKLEASLN